MQTLSINTQLLSNRIRNQLAAIQGIAELISIDNFSLQKKIENILTASDELTSVADELTAVSHKEDKLLKNFNILVVEDEPIIQKVHCKILEDLGCHVEVVENGKEAVEKFCNNEYSLILMDVRMPVMDGIEATREIRHLEKERSKQQISIVGLSCDGEGAEEKCMAAGMSAFFVKPINTDKLKQILQQFAR